MARSRTKAMTKEEASTRVDALFDEGSEQVAALEQRAEAFHAEHAEERLAADLAGEQPPPHEKIDRPNERAWESYPLVKSRKCLVCGGRLRRTGELDEPESIVEVFTCKLGHEGQRARRKHEGSIGEESAERVAAAEAAAINEGTSSHVTGHATATAEGNVVHVRPSPPHPVPMKLARVVFHPVDTTRLEQINYDDFGNITEEGMGVAAARVAGAFVKVSAELRPSERETFDGARLKAEIRKHGAIAVLLEARPVAESPDKAAKEETSSASTPAEAITAWFDGLPVPVDEREAAKTRALEILAKEG